MARPALFAGLLSLSVGLALGGAATAEAAPPTPSEAPGASVSGADAGAPPTAEQVRRGIVQVEQAGRPLSVGVVLSRDGRVLTALSALASAAEPEIRYADGTVVKAKIGHKDRAWDLALLIPQSGRWLDGLSPTDSDPQGVELRSFLPKAGKLAAAQVAVKGRLDARSKEGDALPGALELDLKGNPGVPGAPLIDATGKVVGVLVKACKAEPGSGSAPAAALPCTAVTVGAPVYALRGFLVKTPASAVQPSAWLGLGGAPTESGNVRGVRVVGIAPGSPAEKAGLKAGGDTPDTIVAVDGVPVETPEQLAEVIAKRAIGQQVKLLVFSGGKFREAAVTLRPAP
jgi:serine protease Do